MKKLIIAIVVLGVLVAGGYFLYKYYLSGVFNPKPQIVQTSTGFNVTQGGTTMSMNELQSPVAYNYGVSIYPNAKAAADQARGAQATEGTKKITTGIFTTNDLADKVVSYYTKEFGADAQVGDNTIGTTVWKTIRHKGVPTSPVVAVSSQSNKTTIQIVSFN